jgi:predicted esterase
MVEVTEEASYYRFCLKSEMSNTESTEDIGYEKDMGSVEETKAWRNSRGILFYPGGKVDEVAYAPLLMELAEMGYEVYLVKMPAKLAIFGMNRADAIIEDSEHISEWIMMGHSLGGAMAASYSAAHDEVVDGLVLLAAYSTEDLKDKEIDVYSFYGSEDQVLNMEKYKEYYSNLPEDTLEVIIEGGNHAYYGFYGEQEGDGTATITREAQIEAVVREFVPVW